MPRAARKAPGGQLYHVLNRAVGKRHLFGKDADFEAFQRVMIEAHQRQPIRILSYCVLSNHWHFAVWPDADGQGSRNGDAARITSCVPVSIDKSYQYT